MNFREKYLKRKQTLSQISKGKLNQFIHHKSAGFNHEHTKFLLYDKLIREGYDIICEAIFKNGQRADMVILDQNGEAIILEIMDTETEERLSKKKYPFPIRKVHTKDFDINSWKF